MTVMRKMKIILITIFLIISNSTFACTCGSGEYFYTIDKLEGKLVEAKNYFKENYGINNLKKLKTKKLIAKIEGNSSVVSVSLSIPKELRGHDFHFILESTIRIEETPRKGYVTKSVFQKLVFKPKKEILELSTRMKSNGNEWHLYLLALDSSNKITAMARNSGSVSMCGSIDTYVASVERAKELDLQRNSGCYQTWGYE